MIWIFDLDETLYDEGTYVISGLKHVAQQLSEKNQDYSDKLFSCMESELNLKGRSGVFQKLLTSFPELHFSTEMLVESYRNHKPTIMLYSDAKKLLHSLPQQQMYLVTDGVRVTQWNKIEALKLQNVFRGIYVTDEHGDGAAKPSTSCFEKIRNDCGAEWTRMIYVADDPNKDFINLKKLGVRTIRVNRGRFKDVHLDDNHEAEIIVENLQKLPQF